MINILPSVDYIFTQFDIVKVNIENDNGIDAETKTDLCKRIEEAKTFVKFLDQHPKPIDNNKLHKILEPVIEYSETKEYGTLFYSAVSMLSGFVRYYKT